MWTIEFTQIVQEIDNEITMFGDKDDEVLLRTLLRIVEISNLPQQDKSRLTDAIKRYRYSEHYNKHKGWFFTSQRPPIDKELCRSIRAKLSQRELKYIGW